MNTIQAQQVKPVQKRTKSACVHCQTAKVACSSARPCVWCIRHGLQDTCVDAPKKERKRKSPDSDQTTPVAPLPVTTTYNNIGLTTYNNVNIIPQPYTFTTTLDQIQFSPLPVLDEIVDEFTIDHLLSSASMLMHPGSAHPPTSPSVVPNLDILPTYAHFDSTLPPTSSMNNDIGDDFANILIGEIKRAQSSMENVALLTQARNTPHLLPNATIKLPELLICECNDLFARLLDYNSAVDLVAAQITMLDIIYPQLRALLQRRATKFAQKKEAKIIRTALLQTRIGNAKCCTIVIKPCVTHVKVLILRQTNGVPERAARKIECITALNYAKHKKIVVEDQ